MKLKTEKATSTQGFEPLRSIILASSLYGHALTSWTSFLLDLSGAGETRWSDPVWDSQARWQPALDGSTRRAEELDRLTWSWRPRSSTITNALHLASKLLMLLLLIFYQSICIPVLSHFVPWFCGLIWIWFLSFILALAYWDGQIGKLQSVAVFWFWWFRGI